MGGGGQAAWFCTVLTCMDMTHGRSLSYTAVKNVRKSEMQITKTRRLFVLIWALLKIEEIIIVQGIAQRHRLAAAVSCVPFLGRRLVRRLRAGRVRNIPLLRAFLLRHIYPGPGIPAFRPARRRRPENERRAARILVNVRITYSPIVYVYNTSFYSFVSVPFTK